METKNQLYIFGKKEIGLLIAMGLGIATFSFTLGIHMGKRIAPKVTETKSNSGTPLETATDKIPDRHELAEQAKSVQGAADESLNQSLHDEVTRTGIKLDIPRQIELPKNTKGKAGGATSTHGAKPEAKVVLQEDSHSKMSEKDEEKTDNKGEAKANTKTEEKANLTTHQEVPKTDSETHESSESSSEAASVSGKYALQIGSFPSRAEAETKLKDLGSSGLAGSVHEADVKGKGTWYRVYLGAFATKKVAEKAAESLQQKKTIDHFVVVENQ
ncbi:SPOR domain-containing protein [Bdellovibrionota bacterium FG-2]